MESNSSTTIKHPINDLRFRHKNTRFNCVDRSSWLQWNFVIYLPVIHRLYLIQSSTCCSILKPAALEIHAARSISSLSGVGSCTLPRCTRTKERCSGVGGYMRGITYAVVCVGDFPYAVYMSWQTAIRAVSQRCERIVLYIHGTAQFSRI